MGCGSSKAHPRQNILTNNSSKLEIARIHEAIKKNDVFLFDRNSGLEKISENYGTSMEPLTCLHFAAEHNSFNIISHILEILQTRDRQAFQSLINGQDKNKRSAAMIAVMKNFPQSFESLLKYKAFDTQIKDIEGKSLLDYLAASKECDDLYKKQTTSKSVKAAPESPREKPKKLMSRGGRFLAPDGEDGDPVLADLKPTHKAYQIYKKCVETNTPFTDPDFPAHVDSITLNKNDGSYELFSTAVWKRPNDFMMADFSEIKVFDSIDPNDIMQGQLGVCYFLASLSSLAEFPTRLIDLFLIKKANKQGVYAIQFYVDGIPTEVVVDDIFPCYGNNPNMPLFSRAKGKELWVMLLEKAWGKLFKHFTIAASGDPAWALPYLTGAPAKTYFLDKIEHSKAFQMLLEADKHNWLMTCSVKPGDKLVNDFSLVTHHAYSIIQVYQIGSLKLLKLRNPWGKTEYNGDYSDNSDKWTDDLKQQVGFVQAEDGMFFMTFEDFSKFYEVFSICYQNDNWYYNYYKVNSDSRHATYYEFEVNEDTVAMFRIHEPDERVMKQKDPNYKSSRGQLNIHLIINETTVEDLVPLSGKDVYAFHGNYVITPQNEANGLKLKPGKYLVRTKVMWRSGEVEPYTISVYSSRRINLVTPEVAPNDSYFKSMARGFAGKQTKKAIMDGLHYVDGWSDYDVYYFVLINDGNQAYQMEWTLKNHQDMVFKKCNKIDMVGEDKVKLKVAPGESDAIIVKKKESTKQVAPQFDWKFTKV